MTHRFGARICGPIVVLVMLVTSARGQGGAAADTPPAAPTSQVVALTDLEGAKIHAKLVTDMLAKRQGRQGPATQEGDWQIYLESDGRINFSYRPTTRTPRGTRTAPVLARSVKLDEPWPTQNGDAVWQFKDGDLTFVRSYEGGAVRIIISLKRDGQNLTCTASSVYAHEQGKSLVLNSPIDGVPVTILSWKPVSSTCEITRQ